MEQTRSGKWLGILASAWVAIALLAQPAAAQFDPGGPPTATTDGTEVLTRGPLHEAFAEPVVLDPGPGPVTTKQPPPPVEELPPDQKPEGADVQWIPGYWAWDDGRNDFLWISGLWRDVPPGRQWVPGYWGEAGGGYRWVPGAWTPTAQQELRYYAVPPQSLEAGPNTPPPSANSAWSPGYWEWQGDRFLWRPGFWVPLQVNWIWVPAHYVWTPSGCLFVQGYWDLPIDRRGTPFAPVYFAQPVYQQPRFVYTPTISLVASALVSSLFVRPSYNQYYFGDYYAESYNQAGIIPWHAYHQSRRGYDPLFAHESAFRRRSDPLWLNRVQEDYRYRRDNPAARPPHTYIEQQNIVINKTVNNVNVTNVQNSRSSVRNLVVARPLSQVAANRDHPQRFTRVDEPRRQALADQARQVQAFRQQRQKEEVQAPGSLQRVHVRDQAKAQGNSGPHFAQPHRAEQFRSSIAASPRQPVTENRPGPRPLVPGDRRDEVRQQRPEQGKSQRQQQEQAERLQQLHRAEQAQAAHRQQQSEQLKAQRQHQEQAERLQQMQRAAQAQAAHRQQLEVQQHRQQMEQAQAQQRLEPSKGQGHPKEQMKQQRHEQPDQPKHQQRQRGKTGERPQGKKEN